MNNNRSCFIFILLLFSNASFGQIGVIVNKTLYPAISPAVKQYVSDLKNIQKFTTVWVDSTHFLGGTSRIVCSALRDTTGKIFIDKPCSIGYITLSKDI